MDSIFSLFVPISYSSTLANDSQVEAEPADELLGPMDLAAVPETVQIDPADELPEARDLAVPAGAPLDIEESSCVQRKANEKSGRQCALGSLFSLVDVESAAKLMANSSVLEESAADPMNNSSVLEENARLQALLQVREVQISALQRRLKNDGDHEPVAAVTKEHAGVTGPRPKALSRDRRASEGDDSSAVSSGATPAAVFANFETGSLGASESSPLQADACNNIRIPEPIDGARALCALGTASTTPSDAPAISPTEAFLLRFATPPSATEAELHIREQAVADVRRGQIGTPLVAHASVVGPSSPSHTLLQHRLTAQAVTGLTASHQLQHNDRGHLDWEALNLTRNHGPARAIPAQPVVTAGMPKGPIEVDVQVIPGMPPAPPRQPPRPQGVSKMHVALMSGLPAPAGSVVLPVQKSRCAVQHLNINQSPRAVQPMVIDRPRVIQTLPYPIGGAGLNPALR